MQRCLDLATLGLGNVAPNPLVGCVIAHNNTIIGEGWHREFGGPHAEVHAIKAVEDVELLQRATLYVNLEPCTHHGKTPPCVDLILSMRIPEVVIGNVDPFHKVAGQGIEKLRSGGVKITTGVLEPEGRELNRRFFTFHEQKRPFIILKWAETMDAYLDVERFPGDGKTALRITDDEADEQVHRWRSEEQSILIGKNTAMLDNPQLTVRHCKGRNPLRLVVDPRLELAENLKILSDGRPTWVFNALKEYCRDAVCYVRIEDPSEFPKEIAAHLYHNDIQSVIIEGGGDTLQRFYDAGLWDEARILKGPQRTGSGVRAPSLGGERLVRQERVGNALLQVYYR